eukprot:3055853-Alexandrium_andersonii.AAC.1
MSRRPQKCTPPSWPCGKQQRASQSTPSPVAAEVMVPPHLQPHRVGSPLRPSSPTGAIGSPTNGVWGSA